VLCSVSGAVPGRTCLCLYIGGGAGTGGGREDGARVFGRGVEAPPPARRCQLRRAAGMDRVANGGGAAQLERIKRRVMRAASPGAG